MMMAYEAKLRRQLHTIKYSVYGGYEQALHRERPTRPPSAWHLE